MEGLILGIIRYIDRYTLLAAIFLQLRLFTTSIHDHDRRCQHGTGGKNNSR